MTSNRFQSHCAILSAVATLSGIAITSSVAHGATTGFNQTAAGPWDYNSTANWVGGTINGVWDASLTTTAHQTTTFATNTLLTTGLTFGYGGNFDETLRSTGGNFTLTLGGDIRMDTVQNRSLTFGSTTANQNLNVNLGGVTRTVTVTGSGNGASFGRSINFTNTVSNGGIVVSGGGTGGGRVSLRGASNTLTTISVEGAELAIDGSGTSTANTVTTLSGALGIGSGVAMVTLTPQSTKNTLLQADSFTRTGGIVLFRGTSLGANSIASATENTTNIKFATSPTLQGAGGANNTTTLSILPGAIGDTTTAGTGLGATGGLVTYDTTNGVRLLSGSEYASSIVDQQTQLDNVRYTSTGSTQTTTLTAGTTSTINSLSFVVTGATGTQGMTVTGGAGSVLKISSGVLYATQNVTGGTNPAAGDAMTLLVPTVDFNGKDAVITVATRNNTGGTTTSAAPLRIDSALTNATSLTLGSTPGASNYMRLLGGVANSVGTTIINGANVQLDKSISNAAVTGNLIINRGAVYDAGDEIADSSNVTINGGALYLNGSNNSGSATNETIGSLTMNGGSISPGSGSGNTLNLGGSLTLTGGSLPVSVGGKLNVTTTSGISGGALTIGRSSGTNNTTNAIATLTGALTLTNTASGAFTPISVAAGSASNINGGQLLLKSSLTFVGNATNANTTTIDAPTGAGPQGTFALNGTQTFNIGNGAADADLTIVTPIVNSVSAGGITKIGAGTLELAGINTYTGPTTIDAGTLRVTGSIASGSAISVNGGTLSGTGTVGAVTVASGGTVAPGNSPGILNTGDVAFASASTFAVELNGTALTPTAEHDQLNVTGTVSLGGATLSAVLGYAPQDGDKLFIINNDGLSTDTINGRFAGLLNDGDLLTLTYNSTAYNFAISYTGDSGTGSLTGGNDVVLSYAVPEPASLGALSLGMLAMLRRRRA